MNRFDYFPNLFELFIKFVELDQIIDIGGLNFQNPEQLKKWQPQLDLSVSMCSSLKQLRKEKKKKIKKERKRKGGKGGYTNFLRI